MDISQASLNDLDEINVLVNNAYRGDNSRKGWTTEADLLDGIRIDKQMLEEYFLDSNTSILKCCNEQGQIVGCVYLKQANDQLYLGMLTVEPGLQGKGIGKLLLSAAEEKATDLHCNSVVMTVISSRKELIDWYKRHGYTETGETQPFPKSERFGKPKLPLEFIVLQKKVLG